MGIASPRSRISNLSNNAMRRRRKSREQRVDSLDLLQYNLKLMRTFNYDKFEEGTEYLKKLLRRKDTQNVSYFLSQHINAIIETYTEVISGVMPSGVNYSLDSSNYQTIFVPLQSFIILQDLTVALRDEVIEPFVICIIEKLVNSNQEKDELEQIIKSGVGDSEKAMEQLAVAGSITKLLNSIMLKSISSWPVTGLIKGLGKALYESRESPEWPNKRLIKTNSLASKCVLRSVKKVPGNIQKLNLDELFYYVIMYTQTFEESPEDANSWKIFRSLINELVKSLDHQHVWDCYYRVAQGLQDRHVSKWIKACQINLERSLVESQFLPSQSAFNPGFSPAPSHRSGRSQPPAPKTHRAHAVLVELINKVNRETRRSHVGQLLRDIRDLVKTHRNLDFEPYAQFFSRQKYFDRIANSLTFKDDISDIQSVISTNTRRTRQEKPKGLKKSRINQSYKSIHSSNPLHPRHNQY